MLQNTRELCAHKLTASDGEIGHVKDFYFDDKAWVIRYLVADTGSWLTGRQVLLSPHAFGRVDRNEKTFAVNLTRKQIEGSPSIESHRPVSRQYEEDYYGYYGWPAYWEGGGLWGMAGNPAITPLATLEKLHHHGHNQRDDLHLRSVTGMKGYGIQASDGEIGSVSGFMVDEKSWAIRDLIVETGHWFSSKEILIAPGKIARISHEDSKVFVKLTKAAIEHTAENEAVKSRA